MSILDRLNPDRPSESLDKQQESEPLSSDKVESGLATAALLSERITPELPTAPASVAEKPTVDIFARLGVERPAESEEADLSTPSPLLASRLENGLGSLPVEDAHRETSETDRLNETERSELSDEVSRFIGDMDPLLGHNHEFKGAVHDMVNSIKDDISSRERTSRGDITQQNLTKLKGIVEKQQQDTTDAVGTIDRFAAHIEEEISQESDTDALSDDQHRALDKKKAVLEIVSKEVRSKVVDLDGLNAEGAELYGVLNNELAALDTSGFMENLDFSKVMDVLNQFVTLTDTRYSALRDIAVAIDDARVAIRK